MRTNFSIYIFTGRRSVDKIESSVVLNLISQPKSLSIPFNAVEHRARNRRMATTGCNHLQHLLFVLDTSGSIGKEDFDTVTSLLGNIVPLFCSRIRIAVMTFDHEYYIEFCFKKYQNDDVGRTQAGCAISSIPYVHPGQTHTAGAVKCICNYILDPDICGLDMTCNDVKVVFFTDGQANDRTRDVCTEISCLHNDLSVDTLVISVGDPDHIRLNCMRDKKVSLDEYPIFNFGDFQELEEEFNTILATLFDPNTPKYNCNVNDYQIIG